MRARFHSQNGAQDEFAQANYSAAQSEYVRSVRTMSANLEGKRIFLVGG